MFIQSVRSESSHCIKSIHRGANNTGWEIDQMAWHMFPRTSSILWQDAEYLHICDYRSHASTRVDWWGHDYKLYTCTLFKGQDFFKIISLIIYDVISRCLAPGHWYWCGIGILKNEGLIHNWPQNIVGGSTNVWRNLQRQTRLDKIIFMTPRCVFHLWCGIFP